MIKVAKTLSYNQHFILQGLSSLAPMLYTHINHDIVKCFLFRNQLANFHQLLGVVGWCKGVVYLTSPGRPTDIGLQLGKACYPCSR